MNKPRAPKQLGISGGAFYKECLSAYVLDARDIPILLEACSVLDIIDELKQVIERDGVLTLGSKQQSVAHPALGALARQHASLDRLLTRLGLPDSEGSAPLSVAQLRAQKASRARREAGRQASGQ